MSNPAPDPLDLVPLSIRASGVVDATLRLGMLKSAGIIALPLRDQIMVRRKDHEDAVRILAEVAGSMPEPATQFTGIIDPPREASFGRLLPWALGTAFLIWIVLRLY